MRHELAHVQRPSLLASLRTATRTHHDRLETHPALRALASAGIDRATYRDLLGAFFGFYRVLEPRLESEAARAGLALDLAARRKLPWLRSDLRALGLSDEAVEGLPSPSGLPSIAGPPAVLGALYVVEGSTLGGRVLLRRLLRGGELRDAGALRFFRGHGDQTGAMWRELAALLEAPPSSSVEPAGATRTACALFESLQAWLHERVSEPVREGADGA